MAQVFGIMGFKKITYASVIKYDVVLISKMGHAAHVQRCHIHYFNGKRNRGCVIFFFF